MKTIAAQYPTGFDQQLEELTDGALQEVLGPSGAAAIYYHLKNFGIKKGSLYKDVEGLERAMRDIFRDGWEMLRKLIIQSLCQKIGLDSSGIAERSFAEEVSVAKEHFLKKIEGQPGKLLNPTRDVLPISSERISMTENVHFHDQFVQEPMKWVIHSFG